MPKLGDRLRMSKPSQYVISHLGQLSLANPLWVGAVSNSKSFRVHRHATWCTSPMSVPRDGPWYQSKTVCNFLLVSNTNLHPISLTHTVSVIYWSHFGFWQGYPSLTHLTLEQSTCWRPVCVVTYNISPEAENSFISAILPRHCFITVSSLKLLCKQFTNVM